MTRPAGAGRRDASPVPRTTDEGGGRAAGLVSAGILLSRVAGLVRERALAHFFGSSVWADAWKAALRLPNLLQNLLGEGTLSASFIPIYAGMEEGQRNEAARRFAGAVFGLLFVAAGVLVLVGMALAPLLVAVLLAGFPPEQQVRVVGLVRILFPMTGVLVLSAWTLGILNTHRRFFLPYVAPVLWNLSIIGALVVTGGMLGWTGDALLRAVAWGALAGGVLQFGVQLPAALRLLGGFRPSLSTRVEGVPQALRAFLPVVAGRGVVNLGGYADVFLASFLATGALATLGYAQALYMLPISLFGMAAAAGELPELARRRARGQDAEADTARAVQAGMERIAWFLVPSVVAYLALGDVVVAALYETGAFGAPEVRLAWAILGAYALGMGASATSRFLSSAYYAMGDTATPARVAVMRVVLALAVGASLMIPLDTLEVGGGLRFGAVGLALGSAAGAWLELGLLRRGLGRRIGPHAPALGRMARLVGAALLAAGLAWAIREGLAGSWPEAHPVVEAILVLGPMGAAYLALTRAAGVPSPLAALLRRRR
jgi:putative peptidoglycan lipid II flippase